jgi:hypothetical protein
MRMGGSPLLLVGAMVLLAALDFVGAVLAKEWAEERNHWLFAGGLVAFGALFAVYAVSLKLAELSTVTFGWIITLQVGLLLVERIRYAVVLTQRQVGGDRGHPGPAGLPRAGPQRGGAVRVLAPPGRGGRPPTSGR